VAVVEQSALAELRRVHRGPVIDPGDPNYDAARATFNAMHDRRPAVVARPLDVDDVVAAVSFAGRSGLPVAVRGGGHGVASHCVGDESVVVDLRLMRDVAVDPGERTARCGGGCLWEDLDPRSLRHGLATPGGTFGDTGIAGLTLGGGIGHLIGLHGLTLDNLLSATVVTADGQVVTASGDGNGELFWALRGGGGNFGVVVDFTFRLHPVGGLLGGLLVYRYEDASAVLRAWREVMANAPDSLFCAAMLSRSMFADESLVVSVASFGDVDEEREAIRPLTEVVEPVVDGVRPMYYAELQDVFGRMPFGLRHYWSGRFVGELPDELVDRTVEYCSGEGVQGTILFEPMHGAAARIDPDATAFAGREAKYNLTFIGAWMDGAEDERRVTDARGYSAELAPWASVGGYLNYASELAGDTVETEFGARRYERLRAVKRAFDPDNVFRFNHNIVP
jgi:FAD/FMN-containing dehydrogenase